jgi:hypothetical protein
MTKPVTPNDMFDLWQKMMNPGAFPMQNLMFPVLDVKEVEKKIGELETVEHWLKANLGMVQMSIKALGYQRAMLKGGEKARESLEESARATGKSETKGSGESAEEPVNPAMWVWNMMAEAQKAAVGSSEPSTPKKKKK